MVVLHDMLVTSLACPDPMPCEASLQWESFKFSVVTGLIAEDLLVVFLVCKCCVAD